MSNFSLYFRINHFETTQSDSSYTLNLHLIYASWFLIVWALCPMKVESETSQKLPSAIIPSHWCRFNIFSIQQYSCLTRPSKISKYRKQEIIHWQIHQLASKAIIHLISPKLEEKVVLLVFFVVQTWKCIQVWLWRWWWRMTATWILLASRKGA